MDLVVVVTKRKKSRLIRYLLAARASGRMELTEMKLTTSGEIFVRGGRFRSSAFDVLNWQSRDVKQAVGYTSKV